MNGYNREVDPHPRHGYGIDVEGLSWLISSISTSDKALERKKENRNYLSEEIFAHYYNFMKLTMSVENLSIVNLKKMICW